MAAPVRTRALAGPGRIVTASTFTVIFTCPGDRTAIVKSLWLQNRLTTAVDVQLELADPPTASRRFLDTTGFPFAGREHRYYDLWVVLEEGMTLSLLCTGANALNYHLSGTLLLGDPA